MSDHRRDSRDDGKGGGQHDHESTRFRPTGKRGTALHLLSSAVRAIRPRRRAGDSTPRHLTCVHAGTVRAIAGPFLLSVRFQTA
jgi:hypothetical protein